jgi:DNA/RNA-binding domain of Phe-tRNA-synthetase-like protein
MVDEPAALLRRAHVEPSVFELRPDYRAMLLVVDGLTAHASDTESDALLREAEAFARDLLSSTPVEEVPHVAAWRDAYRAFGAKPQRTRNSLESLLRRAVDGLPRVNRLTDIYNAVSVLHQVPLGGEDLDHYVGAPQLRRASGNESFDTVDGGVDVLESPEPGEVVWCDDEGVTCRRWNWRQGRRTRLTDGTTRALFILDALEPLSDDALQIAADELGHLLARADPGARIGSRMITSDSTGGAVA